MNLNKLILLTLLLSGCAPPATNSIDSAFEPLYDQFISQANASGLSLNPNQGITIQFATLEQKDSLGEVIGECSNAGYGGGTILIDTNFWNNADIDAQTVLLWHELGHCVLSEIHIQDPNAIMYAVIGQNIQYYISNPSTSFNVLLSDKGNSN